jgi:hypothetical protein
MKVYAYQRAAALGRKFKVAKNPVGPGVRVWRVG